eukprot:m.83264 g.83264  ORF g.83264 m.83264 type:complete len:141 (+) comp14649_c0_seq3:113-535(+)
MIHLVLPDQLRHTRPSPHHEIGAIGAIGCKAWLRQLAGAVEEVLAVWSYWLCCGRAVSLGDGSGSADTGSGRIGRSEGAVIERGGCRNLLLGLKSQIASSGRSRVVVVRLGSTGPCSLIQTFAPEDDTCIKHFMCITYTV